MTETNEQRADVVVVGGGPGGSTAATMIAKAGHRVVLLEKERFPRYQIGESLLPSTVHGVCEMLGVTDELAKHNFPVKRGGTFRWGKNAEPWTFTFALSRKLAGPTSTAYQVDRAKFDHILLQNAAKNGVDVREEHDVLALTEDEEGRTDGVRVRTEDGVEREIKARYVVVAAGNADALYKSVAPRIQSPFFQNVALFGYYEGGKRLPAPNSGNVLSVAFSDGWFWYIPLSDELTSVGAVVAADKAHLLQGQREQAMNSLIEKCPMIADYLAEARRVTHGMHGELRIRKDYSYCNSAFWRPGAVLVGDAACFVDPVFSTGVHLATYSGLLAARSVNTSLDGQLAENACFAEYEARYRREYQLFYQFLQSMYDLNRDESSYFWEARKTLATDQDDPEAFVDLVAGVSGPDSVMFDRTAMESFGDAFTHATSEEALNEGDAQFSGSGTRVLGTVLHEATDLQLQGALSGMRESLPMGKPLFEGGLIPSADGFRWRRHVGV